MPDLDELAMLGVSHVDLRCVLAGGRWHVDVEWVGNDPRVPQTLESQTSGWSRHHPSIAAALAATAEEAGDE